MHLKHLKFYTPLESYWYGGNNFKVFSKVLGLRTDGDLLKLQNIGINIDDHLSARKCMKIYVTSCNFQNNIFRHILGPPSTDKKTDEAVRFTVAQSYYPQEVESCIPFTDLRLKILPPPLFYHWLLGDSEAQLYLHSSFQFKGHDASILDIFGAFWGPINHDRFIFWVFKR